MRARFVVLLLVGFAVAWLVAFGLVLASAHLPAATSGRVLAVFLPGLDGTEQRIVDAGGVPLEPFGAFAWTAYARTGGFAGRLRDRGAVLVIPPLGELTFSGICGAGMELFAARRRAP